MVEGGTEDPVVEADRAASPRKQSATAFRPPRLRLWKGLSVVLGVSLVILVTLLTVPAQNVQHTGIEWHSFSSAGQYYLIDSDVLAPRPAQCAESTTVSCSNFWVAFNWSTQDGKPIVFDFYGFGLKNGGENVLLYSSQNLSFGGYSFYCGLPPRGCDDTFQIVTKATSGQTWNFDWETVFNYTTTEPLL